MKTVKIIIQNPQYGNLIEFEAKFASTEDMLEAIQTLKPYIFEVYEDSELVYRPYEYIMR